jgi:hypothetical protein
MTHQTRGVPSIFMPKLSSLVFITEEKYGRQFLDAPMPRAYIKHLAEDGLKVTIEYVKHK